MTIGIDEPQPPYGLSYTSPGPSAVRHAFHYRSDGAVTRAIRFR